MHEKFVSTPAIYTWSSLLAQLTVLIRLILLQSKPVNTDFEGAMERIRINGVSVLTGSRYSSQKDTFYWSKILKKLMRT